MDYSYDQDRIATRDILRGLRKYEAKKIRQDAPIIYGLVMAVILCLMIYSCASSIGYALDVEFSMQDQLAQHYKGGNK